MFERLRRFPIGDSRDYAPMSLILFSCKVRVMLERLRRFAKGDSRD